MARRYKLVWKTGRYAGINVLTYTFANKEGAMVTRRRLNRYRGMKPIKIVSYIPKRRMG